jgi:transcriptional regulator with XRE-family HTH domain
VPVTKQQNESPKNAGATTREFREVCGVKLERLAERAQISVPMLSQFERGKRRLSLDAYRRLALAMQQIEEERSGERDTFAAKFFRLFAAGKDEEIEIMSDEKIAAERKSVNSLEASARAVKILGWVESLERAQSQVNDPVLSEIVQSFRNEIAQLEQQNAELQRRLAEDKSGPKPSKGAIK